MNLFPLLSLAAVIKHPVTQVLFIVFFGFFCHVSTLAQEDTILSLSDSLDALYIAEFEQVSTGDKPKILHAEPLYIDLIRDLGARKGEKEWNIGTGIIDKDKYDLYEALIEYE